MEQPPGIRAIGWFLTTVIAVAVFMVSARLVTPLAGSYGAPLLKLAEFVLTVIVVTAVVNIMGSIKEIIQGE